MPTTIDTEYQPLQFCCRCLRTVGDAVSRPYETERRTEPWSQVWHTCTDTEACQAHRAATEMGATGSALR